MGGEELVYLKYDQSAIRKWQKKVWQNDKLLDLIYYSS